MTDHVIETQTTEIVTVDIGTQGPAGPPGTGSTDNDAIHDNVSAEISAITEKVTPVNADLILIEDSADGNSKKRVQAGNLPAASGESTKTSLLAAANVGGQRVVVGSLTGIIYADNTNLDHAGFIIGMTNGAITLGNSGVVILDGKIESSGWGLDITKGVWLSANGQVTQTEPASGFSLSLGVVLDSDTLKIKLGTSIIL